MCMRSCAATCSQYTPIATLQYPAGTVEIGEEWAAAEGKLTAIKAAFVESLIISPSIGGAARWAPGFPLF